MNNNINIHCSGGQKKHRKAQGPASQASPPWLQRPSFTRFVENRLQLGFEDGVHLLQPAPQWQGVGVPHGEGGLTGEDDAWNTGTLEPEGQWPNTAGMWVP